jgi:hypothetical protein
MNAAGFHLAIVHMPLMAATGGFTLLLCARLWHDERPFRLALLLLVAGALAAAGAYYSGPPAHQVLVDGHFTTADTLDLVETHALWGRISFVSMGILGALALQSFLQHYQGEATAAWQRWALLAGSLVMILMMAWTAHLGGWVRHAEIRPGYRAAPAEVITP